MPTWTPGATLAVEIIAAVLVLMAVVGWVALRSTRTRATQTAVDHPSLRAELSQDEYDELLRVDEQERGHPLPACRICTGMLVEAGRVVTIQHPILDASDHHPAGAWSLQVDERTVPACKNHLRVIAGPSIRLPWLDGMPVTLLPRLYARPAFHRLRVEVREWGVASGPEMFRQAMCGAEDRMTPVRPTPEAASMAFWRCQRPPDHPGPHACMPDGSTYVPFRNHTWGDGAACSHCFVPDTESGKA